MKHASAGTGIDLTPGLDGWVGAQRWFAGKAHSPVLRSIGQWPLPADEAGVRISCHILLDTASRFATLYQLPLTERAVPLPDPAALIGQTTGPDGLPRYVYDAPHDPAYAAALFRFIATGAAAPATAPQQADAKPAKAQPAEAQPAEAQPADALPNDERPNGPRPQSPAAVTARGGLLHTSGAPDSSAYTVTASRVLSGEQSNTSIILDIADEHGRPGRPVICKVFRVIAAGENPDVSVQSALAGAGSRFVPEPIGAVTGEWDDPLAPVRHSGHLVFAQEFLPGVEDAWRVALGAAAAGEDFSGPAHALGVATAAVHRDLGRAFPTVDATPAVVHQLCSTMRERFRLAALEVPELAGHHAAIEAVFARAQAAPWPRLQRIHGDYHLGQVLDVPGRGWVLIDFEGEPLRPLAERSLPDIPLRDVAGMLRSFDYVGATIAMHDPAAQAAATEWATTARAAFLRGYHEHGGAALAGQEPLLAAFELDKAVYESIYENRNRPSWLPIPLRAVRRLAQEAHAASAARR